MLDSLDALVEEHHLLRHPFYQAWTQGKLSKDSLALYAEQYYQHVRTFPENLKQLAARSNGLSSVGVRGLEKGYLKTVAAR